MRRIDAASRRVAPWCVCAAALFVCASSGCGHRATVEECEEIVERIARLDLEKRMPNNPAAVEQQVEAMKAQLNDSIMKDCKGRRITDRAMRCVRQAKTSQEIVERCFD